MSYTGAVTSTADFSDSGDFPYSDMTGKTVKGLRAAGLERQLITRAVLPGTSSLLFRFPSPPLAPAPRRRASVSSARDVGVKGIMRGVIHTLEGLAHLDPALEAEDDDDDEHEVARALADAERRVGK
ncbi:hypothetical protein DFH09DRAFT_1330249 [Mycena vulgaris]|nr:hypothetical protein DFH09DRAFT_1330249 [Mycena vulgaris]